MQEQDFDPQMAKELVDKIVANVKKVIVGKDDKIRTLIMAWIANGHILIEDLPGTGKTILVRALAKSVQVGFSRVQFTPDLLPTDLIGAAIYNQKQSSFEFHEGPIFTTLLLADEINRATPRTQSALLESMSEKQVTAEGDTRKLNKLFCTIATQNPVEQLGTFELPEAQLDRFLLKMSIGYPTKDEEVEMAKSQNDNHPIHSLEAVASESDINWLKSQVAKVFVSDEIYAYITSIVSRTRKSDSLEVGASPRSTLSLVKSAQAYALMQGESFVLPSHVQDLAIPILAHRIKLSTEAKMSDRTPEQVLEKIIKLVPVPIEKAS